MTKIECEFEKINKMYLFAKKKGIEFCFENLTRIMREMRIEEDRPHREYKRKDSYEDGYVVSEIGSARNTLLSLFSTLSLDGITMAREELK